jgi:hypothetical protein
MIPAICRSMAEPTRLAAETRNPVTDFPQAARRIRAGGGVSAIKHNRRKPVGPHFPCGKQITGDYRRLQDIGGAFREDPR